MEMVIGTCHRSHVMCHGSRSQVVDPVAGWTFREYGTTTWEFVVAAFRPKFLLCSATMSEKSLSRAAGLCLVILKRPF